MIPKDNLIRFIDAQKGEFESALEEIRNGKKTRHWMWFVFPQLQGLGQSQTSKFYAIKDQSEATQYLSHPVLGSRLIEISSELLKLSTNNAIRIFGPTDSLKLRSSMTLFSLLENTNPVFQKVLDKYYGGIKDEATISLLNA